MNCRLFVFNLCFRLGSRSRAHCGATEPSRGLFLLPWDGASLRLLYPYLPQWCWLFELASQSCSTIAGWSVGRIDGTIGEAGSSAVATAFRGVGGGKNLVSKTGLLRPLLALVPAGGTKTITSVGPVWLRPCHRLQHRQCMLLFALLCCLFRFQQLCSEVLLKKSPERRHRPLHSCFPSTLWHVAPTEPPKPSRMDSLSTP